jgi:Neprosin
MTTSRIRLAIAGLSLALALSALSIGTAGAASSGSTAVAGLPAPKPQVPSGPAGHARPHATPALCSGGLCYFFASMYASDATSTGATVMLNQARPKVVTGERSATMIAVGSTDDRQSILFGWMVSKTVFGDTLPHLAMNAIVNDVPHCLNACGFVPVSKGIHAGSRVTVGQLGKYTIKLSKARWLLVYNGTTIGYFPTSLWSGNKLARSHLSEAFGAVSSPSSTTPRSDMGNGRLGADPRSAKIVGLKLVGGVGAPTFTYVAIDAPAKYNVGFIKPACRSACNMNYGGPGF